MTTRQAVARLLYWLLDRVEPAEPTTDIMTPPVTIYTTYADPYTRHLPGYYPWPPNGGTTSPLPWPGSTITYTNGSAA